MSAQAEEIRSIRRNFAAPHGRHDRLIAFLRVALPMAIGAFAAVLAFAPFAMRGELSFVLDKNSVDIARERLRVEEALYRGEDNRGRPFSLRAGAAVQKSSRVPVVELSDLSARILLDDGPAQIRADRGSYNMKAETVGVDGPVHVEAASGYRLATSDVTVDLNRRTLESKEPVEGRTNIGTFHANRLRIDMTDRRIVLDGAARLRIEQGALRGR